MRQIDMKHHIEGDRVVKTSTNEPVPDDEPMILYRGRDRLALPMLRFYRQLCQDDGATNYQLRSMDEMIARFEKYAASHPVKQPGITQGAKWDGVPS